MFITVGNLTGDKEMLTFFNYERAGFKIGIHDFELVVIQDSFKS